MGSDRRARTGRVAAAIAYVGGAIVFFVMAGYTTAIGLRGSALILIAGDVAFLVLAYAAARWGVGTGQGSPCVIYLAKHGYGMGSPRRRIPALRPWTHGLEIDLRRVRGDWWLSIRDGFSQYVQARLEENEENVMKVRDSLERWQTSRVCVER